MDFLYNCIECNGWFNDNEMKGVAAHRVYENYTVEDDDELCQDCAGKIMFGVHDEE